MKKSEPTPAEDTVPIDLLSEESAAWLGYGDAVLSGASSGVRRTRFKRAMGVTERCLDVVRGHREAQATAQKAAA